MGDGRAVLRSSIREFLCSEAMHHLGIPTTRAFAVIGSDQPVRRETLETAAVVTRVAPSFVRFGHFEHFYTNDRGLELQHLADHVIDRFYPQCREADDPYLALLNEVTLRTADLMADWQAVGFCHGVMNTDNMSILGLTIDYGPFGFIDGFNANHICNHTDTQGRYAYKMQPQVAYWNLFCLAQALVPLFGLHYGQEERGEKVIEDAQRVLEGFKNRFAPALEAKMARQAGPRGSARRRRLARQSPVRNHECEPRRLHADVPQSREGAHKPTRPEMLRCATCSSTARPSIRGRTTIARACRKKHEAMKCALPR